MAALERLLALATLSVGLALPSGCVVFNEECSPQVKDPEEITGYLGGQVSTLKTTVRVSDNAIGELVAESYFNAFPKTPPDFGFENSGSIRSEGICTSHETVPKGPVKRKVLREVLPFDDTLASVNVTHLQLKNMFEHAIAGLSQSGTASPPGAFLQIYGGTVAADCKLPAETLNADGSRAKEGSRITAITLQKRDGSTFAIGLPPSATATVRIAVNSYMLSGGDGYVDLKDIDVNTAKSGYVQGDFNFEVIAAYFKLTYTAAKPLPVPPATKWILTDCH